MKCPNCGQETEVITLGGREYCNKCGREIVSNAGFEVHENPKEVVEPAMPVNSDTTTPNELGGAGQEIPQDQPLADLGAESGSESVISISDQPVPSALRETQGKLESVESVSNQSVLSASEELDDLPIGGENKPDLPLHEVEQQIPVSINEEIVSEPGVNQLNQPTENFSPETLPQRFDEPDTLPQTPVASAMDQSLEIEKPKFNLKKPLLMVLGLLLLGGIFFGAYTLYNGASVKDLVGLGFPKDAKEGLEKALSVQSSKTALTAELNASFLGYGISSKNIQEEGEKYSADIEIKPSNATQENNANLSYTAKVKYAGEDKIYTNLTDQVITGGYWLESSDEDLNKMFASLAANSELESLKFTKFLGAKNKEMDISNFSNIKRVKDEKLDDVSYYRVTAETDFNKVFGAVVGDTTLFASSGTTDFYIDKKEYFIKRIVFDTKLNSLGDAETARFEYVYSAYDKSFDIQAPTNVLQVSSFISEFGEAIKTNDFSKVQPKVRDARRKADLKVVLSTLTKYKDEKNQYPILTDDTTDGSFLEPASKYLDGKMPLDPLHPSNYYKYVGSDGNTFVLSAVLENTTDPQGVAEGSLVLYKLTQADILE